MKNTIKHQAMHVLGLDQRSFLGIYGPFKDHNEIVDWAQSAGITLIFNCVVTDMDDARDRVDWHNKLEQDEQDLDNQF